MKKLNNLVLLLIWGIIFCDNIQSQIEINIGNDTILCFPQEYQLQPYISGGVEPYSYCWEANYSIGTLNITASSFLNDTTIRNPILLNSPINDTLLLKLTVTDYIGNNISDSINIFSSSLASILIDLFANINSGDSVTLYSNIGGGIKPYNYQWYPNININDTTIANPTAYPTSTTFYHCIVTDTGGCSTESDVFEVFVTIEIGTIGIKENNYKIDIYPNYATSSITVDYNLATNVRNASIKITNQLGAVVYSYNISSETTSFTTNISSLSIGTYTVSLVCDGIVVDSKNLVKQ